MRALLGLVVVAALAIGVYYFYFEKAGPQGGTAGAIESISTTAVKNDLIAISNAERMYFTQNGKYATLDELISSGHLRMDKPGRDGYVYKVEASGSGFTATARYTGVGNYPTLAIDQTMRISEDR